MRCSASTPDDVEKMVVVVVVCVLVGVVVVCLYSAVFLCCLTVWQAVCGCGRWNVRLSDGMVVVGVGSTTRGVFHAFSVRQQTP